MAGPTIWAKLFTENLSFSWFYQFSSNFIIVSAILKAEERAVSLDVKYFNRCLYLCKVNLFRLRLKGGKVEGRGMEEERRKERNVFIDCVREFITKIHIWKKVC